jgi:heme A synthase
MENNPYNLPAWFLKTFKILLFEVVFLIALGGSVRVMNAGLACPDWPLCFGDFIPDYHPQVYLEFLHRVLAGFIALVTTFLSIYLMRKPLVPMSVKVLGGLSILLLIAQVVLGGLTVLWQLHSKVVAAHLGLATAFFAMILWMYLTLRTPREAKPLNKSLLVMSVLLLVMTFSQIILGGLVASHYASLVCTDFPLCHGQLFPTFKGILGLHVIHRTFAYVVAGFGLFYFFWVRRQTADVNIRWGAKGFALLVMCQFAVGILNVVLHTPPLIAVIHLTFATGLLGFATYLVRRTSANI